MKMENKTGFPSGVSLLAGSSELTNIPEIPFADQTLSFLSEISGQIRRIPGGNAGEELKALGFWLRRSHLIQMKEQYGRSDALGLGITFHIAPSNIPLMFAYTCAIGLMAGNSCLVRLSERRSEESDRLCKLIDRVLEKAEFQSLKHRVALITYDRMRTDLTEYFSRMCDGRVIWGGDRTVEEIRRIPVKPTAAELVFPDRTSIAVFDAAAVLSLDGEELKNLADRFYNDTYGMDQNACSCPGIMFWREEAPETGRAAADRFWNAVAEASERYALSEIKVSQKYGALWECAGLGAEIRQFRRWKNRLYVLELADIPVNTSGPRMQFGSFMEYHMKNEEDWTKAVSEKTQSVIAFGISRDSLRQTALLHRLRGTHRIVPVGQALWLDLVWDGKDMLGQLSRTIQ